MEYTRPGDSGLKIGRIAMGCMSFGDTSRGFSQWALDDAAEPIFRQAVELGVSFWDLIEEEISTLEAPYEIRRPTGYQ